jgi:glutathione reductase (NADPH)
MSAEYDLIVIGGGSGGLACAKRCAGYGARVLVAEFQAMGGTCVNLGCVPKKVMWYASYIGESLHDAHHFGYTGGSAATFDWNFLKTARDTYIQRLNGIYERGLTGSNVTFVKGFASIVDANTVSIDGTLYKTARILIAVGGRPKIPTEVPGHEFAISSDGFFGLESQPASVAVIGGGYIGVELAGVFHGLGSQTHLFTRASKPLKGFDEFIRDALIVEMKRQGLTYHPDEDIVSIVKTVEGKLMLTTTSGESGPYDQIVFATGREPLTADLNLPAAGITVNAGGYIAVDEFQNTSCDSVLALGDVCGRVELTPMAIAAGRKLGDRLFGGQPNAKADYSIVPTVVFSHPTIGVIGLTEDEAVKQYGKDVVKIYKSTFVSLYYGAWRIAPDDKPKYRIIT